MKDKRFKPITQPYIHGWVAHRDDGVDVEVVRCYESQWNVFLTRGGVLVARSIEEYHKVGNGYLPFHEARRIAKTLL